MADRLMVASEGNLRRYLGRERDSSGRIEHFRVMREDLRPHQRRAEAIAKGSVDSREGMRYVGSVPRIVIHEWLQREQKTWNDFAIDEDLKARFMSFYRTEYSRLMADTYRERSLAVNRSRSGRLATSLGSRIVNDYRAELSA
jgi:hypothetical protein